MGPRVPDRWAAVEIRDSRDGKRFGQVTLGIQPKECSERKNLMGLDKDNKT